MGPRLSSVLTITRGVKLGVAVTEGATLGVESYIGRVLNRCL